MGQGSSSCASPGFGVSVASEAVGTGPCSSQEGLGDGGADDSRSEPPRPAAERETESPEEKSWPKARRLMTHHPLSVLWAARPGCWGEALQRPPRLAGSCSHTSAIGHAPHAIPPACSSVQCRPCTRNLSQELEAQPDAVWGFHLPTAATPPAGEPSVSRRMCGSPSKSTKRLGLVPLTTTDLLQPLTCWRTPTPGLSQDPARLGLGTQ